MIRALSILLAGVIATCSAMAAPSLLRGQYVGSGSRTASPHPLAPPNDYIIAAGGEANEQPGDPTADVSQSHFFSGIDGWVRGTRRQEGGISFSIPSNTLFNSVRAGQNTREVRIKYDRVANRFIVAAIGVGSPSRLMLAVSNNGEITDSTVFQLYSFEHTAAAPSGDFGYEPDQLDLAETHFGVHLSYNLYNTFGVLTKSTSLVVNKAQLYAGQTPTIAALRSLNNDVHVSAISSDEVTGDSYLVGRDLTSSSSVRIYTISQTGNNPFLGSSQTLSEPSFLAPPTPSVFGSNGGVQVYDARQHGGIQMQDVFGQAKFILARTIQCDNFGNPNNGGRTAAFWYEYARVGGSFVQQRSQILLGSGDLNYWLPTAAISGQGDTVVLANRGSSSSRLESVSARANLGEIIGYFPPVTLHWLAVANFNPLPASSPQPWPWTGSTRVDPIDNQTMWGMSTMVYSADYWAQVAYRIPAFGPPAIQSASPSTLTPGTNNVTLTGSNANPNLRFFANGPGWPSRGSGKITGAGTSSVGGTISNGGQSVTFPVEVDLGMSSGPVSLTWTNPDGQTVTGGTVNLNIPNPIIGSVTPSQGASRSGPTTITVTGSNFYPGTVIQFQPWNSASFSDRTTTYVSPTQVTVSLSELDLRYGGDQKFRPKNNANIGQEFNWRVNRSIFQGSMQFRLIEGQWVKGGAGSLLTLDGEGIRLRPTDGSGTVIMEIDTTHTDTVFPPSMIWNPSHFSYGGIPSNVTIRGWIKQMSTGKWVGLGGSTQPGQGNNSVYADLLIDIPVTDPPSKWFKVLGGGSYISTIRIELTPKNRIARRDRAEFIIDTLTQYRVY